MSAASPPVRLAGGEVVLADTTARVDVRVDGAAIEAVGPGLGRADRGDELVVDVSGLRVAPGYVDLQVNGGLGIDLTREPGRLGELAADLPRHGVTAFLPTLVSSPPDRVEAALAASIVAETGGAVALGWHLEGPMLAPSRAGAHDVAHLREPSAAVIEGWSRERGVAMVTVAPELPGAAPVIAELTRSGVVVAIGHSDATPDTVDAARRSGARHVTHLFNAMSPMHHRAPGVVGAALAGDDTAGLVVDGVHVSAEAVRVAWRCLGPDRLALVSDASPARGLSAGPATLGSMEVRVGDDGIRTVDGTLAGTDLTLDAAVRNLVTLAGADWSDAVRAASAVPAAVLGDRLRGVIAARARADLVVVDHDLDVVMTIVGGRIVHDPTGRAGS